jgi:hypothetical protein
MSAMPSTSTALPQMARVSASGTSHLLTMQSQFLYLFCRTDRSGASHNANNAGNTQIKPKWTANALNGMGVLRFSRASKTYLDINPVAYLNSKPFVSLFVVARLSDVSNIQYLVSDDSNGLRIFYNGSRW